MKIMESVSYSFQIFLSISTFAILFNQLKRHSISKTESDFT